MTSNNDLSHHKQQEYCTTRPRYRQGKKLTAVKVYTIASESIHLLVFGVPKVNLQSDVRRTFLRHGPIQFIRCVTKEIGEKMELEIFTDVFHIKFEKLEHARRAKRFLDAQQFYGGILHISYAPEYESGDEIRAKLAKRRMEVNYHVRKNQRDLEEHQAGVKNQNS
ncbi:RNA-binding protein 48 [Episyrphus balteatus]|uniref:RNA-binding protein 48 n=1 Tax=Episyrphus balteatus TaxID=286459 RepID=UPI0024850F4C|nr:RNA-binding protein 48 [Episyrphus balteatus]